MNVAIISCFDTFLDRQKALVKLFLDRGDQVTAFLSDFQHVSKSYRTAGLDGFTLVHAVSYRKNLSLRRMYSHYVYASSIQRELEQGKWDLVWAIVPPNSLVKRCAEFKRSHPQTKLVFDVNDLWPESFPLGGLKKLPPFQLWQALRDRNLPEADYIVTECNLFQKRLNLSQTERASTIYLCKPAEAFQLDRTPQLPEDCISLCYLGSINHIIDMDAIASILSSLQSLRQVCLHVIGAGERKEQLLAAAQKAGAKVVDHGSIYDTAEKQAIFNQCHFGLNVMKPTVCVGLTMKSIDYLAGGLPLINTIPGDTWDLIDQYGFGLNWSGEGIPNGGLSDQAQMRLAARAFFEQELTYQNFVQKVNSVLQQL